MINWIIYEIGKFIATVFPMWVGYGVAKVVSFLHFHLAPKDRKAVLFNVRRIMPESDDKTIARISKQVFYNFGKYLTDFFRLSKMDLKFIEKCVRVDNIEHIDSALKRKDGIIVLTAHLGNWELGGGVLSQLGYAFYAAALAHSHPKVDDFFNKQRQSCGVHVIPIGVALKQCYQLLKENKLVAFVGDRSFGGTGVELDFCGKPAVIPQGPARFSLKSGACIVPGFLVREKNDTFCLSFEKPILPCNKDGSLRDETEIIKEYLAVIEKYVKKYPDQWYLFQPFFKE